MMMTFNEISDNDAHAILRIASKREGVVFVERTANTATFSTSSVGEDGQTVDIPFDVGLGTVSDFVKMFPVACFNAKCVDARMKQC